MMKYINFNLNLFRKLSFLLILSIGILFTLELLAKKETGFIEWRSIPGANGYRVEIKKDNKIVLTTDVTKNIYFVDLPKGSYEFRIGVLNFFKKPAVWSYWNPLRVIVSQTPILNSEELSFSKGESASLEGENFLENTKVNLIKNGKVIPISPKISNDKSLSFPTDELDIGTYDISLENPNDKKLKIENFLVLKNQKRKPDKVISKKDLNITSDSLDKADITFEESESGITTVNIGPKTKDKLDITLQNKSKEKVTVDLNNRSEGKVTFNVENKSKSLLALNVNNYSKQDLSVGIVEKSKGKIDINSSKSQNKVDVSTVFAEIEKFDVTIDNKSKEKFDINIGQPPIVFIPPKRIPAKVIDRKDIKISTDSLEKADIDVEDDPSGKMLVNIGPNSKEDLEINMENLSKDKVSVDINNRSEGKVFFNIENKSQENLALNISNTSNENFSLGILEKSKGNVDVKVSENSKEKVKINRTSKEIENFDVTIENKTKEKFDINIGKKVLPPFEASNETFPPNYHKYSLSEFREFSRKLKRTCQSNLDVPDILIHKCNPKHVSLNLVDNDRKVLYNFLKLESGNYVYRISAYKFYIQNCNPALNFISELVEYRMKTIPQDENELFYQRKTIESFKSCKSIGEQ